jgi:hypothetical protein
MLCCSPGSRVHWVRMCFSSALVRMRWCGNSGLRQTRDPENSSSASGRLPRPRRARHAPVMARCEVALRAHTAGRPSSSNITSRTWPLGHCKSNCSCCHKRLLPCARTTTSIWPYTRSLEVREPSAWSHAASLGLVGVIGKGCIRALCLQGHPAVDDYHRPLHNFSECRVMAESGCSQFDSLHRQGPIAGARCRQPYDCNEFDSRLSG